MLQQQGESKNKITNNPILFNSRHSLWNDGAERRGWRPNYAWFLMMESVRWFVSGPHWTFPSLRGFENTTHKSNPPAVFDIFKYSIISGTRPSRDNVCFVLLRIWWAAEWTDASAAPPPGEIVNRCFCVWKSVILGDGELFSETPFPEQSGRHAKVRWYVTFGKIDSLLPYETLRVQRPRLVYLFLSSFESHVHLNDWRTAGRGINHLIPSRGVGRAVRKHRKVALANRFLINMLMYGMLKHFIATKRNCKNRVLPRSLKLMKEKERRPKTSLLSKDAYAF